MGNKIFLNSELSIILYMTTVLHRLTLTEEKTHQYFMHKYRYVRSRLSLVNSDCSEILRKSLNDTVMWICLQKNNPYHKMISSNLHNY